MRIDHTLVRAARFDVASQLGILHVARQCDVEQPQAADAHGEKPG